MLTCKLRLRHRDLLRFVPFKSIILLAIKFQLHVYMVLLRYGLSRTKEGVEVINKPIKEFKIE